MDGGLKEYYRENNEQAALVLWEIQPFSGVCKHAFRFAFAMLNSFFKHYFNLLCFKAISIDQMLIGINTNPFI